MKCWKCKRVPLKLPSCALSHWQTHFFHPNPSLWFHMYISFNSLVSWHIYWTTKHNLEIFNCFPESHFRTFSLRTFWAVKLSAVRRGQKCKWAQKIAKQINRKVYCPLWLLQPGLLLPVHKSPCQYLLSGRAEHFLPFLTFTTSHCQWKSLKLDGHLHESSLAVL